MPIVDLQEAPASLSLGVTRGAHVAVNGPRWECLIQSSDADPQVPVHPLLQPKPRTLYPGDPSGRISTACNASQGEGVMQCYLSGGPINGAAGA